MSKEEKSKKKKTSPLIETVTTNRTVKMTGTLNLENLKGLVLDVEEKGLKDLTNVLKKYDGEFGTLQFTIKESETVDIEDEE